MFVVFLSVFLIVWLGLVCFGGFVLVLSVLRFLRFECFEVVCVECFVVFLSVFEWFG